MHKLLPAPSSVCGSLCDSVLPLVATMSVTSPPNQPFAPELIVPNVTSSTIAVELTWDSTSTHPTTAIIVDVFLNPNSSVATVTKTITVSDVEVTVVSPTYYSTITILSTLSASTEYYLRATSVSRDFNGLEMLTASDYFASATTSDLETSLILSALNCSLWGASGLVVSDLAILLDSQFIIPGNAGVTNPQLVQRVAAKCTFAAHGQSLTALSLLVVSSLGNFDKNISVS
jgi:hypothetical protein